MGSGRAQQFAQIAGIALADSDAAEVDQALGALIDRARAAWPEFALDDERFLSYVAARFQDRSDDVAAAIRELRAQDLLLAAACVDGDVAATAAFHRDYAGVAARAVARIYPAEMGGDDLTQAVIERLLVGDQSPPAIALYAGRGDLTSYVRVAALHAALKQRDKNRRNDARRDDFGRIEELSARDDDPELATLRERYSHEFKAAFQIALESLDAAQRNLLRFHYVSGLTTREIATLTGVNQSTVTRRLAQVRAELLSKSRQVLLERLRVSPAEFGSVMRLVESQIDLSLDRVLSQATAAPIPDSR
jgi:RNA polymerase sigma-70 factor (ECF subfamily)